MGLFGYPKCTSKARMDGKTAVITGGNSCLGIETARELLKRGCRVVLACRNLVKADVAATKLRGEVEGAQVRVIHIDLASLQSVKDCAQQLIMSEPHIHLLINNAARICSYAVTIDGYEMMFQTNHLSHFLLTVLLLDKLRESAPSRVINLTSEGHTRGMLQVDDLQFNSWFDKAAAYAQSKLCNLLFTLELRERLEGSGVVTYAVDPGYVSEDTMFFMPSWQKWFLERMPLLRKTPKEGAQTTLHCALDENLAEQKGLFYCDCRPMNPSWSVRKEDALILWEESEELADFFI